MVLKQLLAAMQKDSNKNMKQILIFIFSLILFNGYGQVLKTLSEIDLGRFNNNILILEKGWSVKIKPESEWLFHIIEFEKNDELKLTDSVDLAADGFNFRLLQLNESNEFIFIIEAIYEYVSYYPVYLIAKGQIKNIGNLNIRLDCNNCDVLNYPLKDIIIMGNDKKVEFSFKRELVLMDKKDFPKFKKDEIKFVYAFNTERLRIEKSSDVNTQ